MNGTAKGFLHGVAYSIAAAILLKLTLPTDANLTLPWLSFVVLDAISCISYAVLVSGPGVVGSPKQREGS